MKMSQCLKATCGICWPSLSLMLHTSSTYSNTHIKKYYATDTSDNLSSHVDVRSHLCGEGAGQVQWTADQFYFSLLSQGDLIQTLGQGAAATECVSLNASKMSQFNLKQKITGYNQSFNGRLCNLLNEPQLGKHRSCNAQSRSNHFSGQQHGL